MESGQRSQRRRDTIGWLFVAIQAILLITVISLPAGEAWSTTGWVRIVGLAAVVGGIGLAVVAGLRLGSALTPTPVPTAAGTLTTSGLYGVVRHPIYSAILLAVAGVVLRSGNLLTLVVGAATVAFFTVKARWEEARLEEHYPEYGEYARAIPRFVPRIPPVRGGRRPPRGSR